MPISRPTFQLLRLSLVTVLLGACDRPPASDSERFQLIQDSHGRTIRLDKATGETAILDGNRLVPVQTGKGASGIAKPQAASPTTAAPAATSMLAPPTSGSPSFQTATPEPVLQVATAEPVAAVPALSPALPPTIADLGSGTAAVPAQPVAGSALVTSRTVQLFLNAERRGIPLLTLATGTVVRFLGVERGSYRVEVAARNARPHVGYVDPRWVVPDSRDLTP